jgi:hypothetical protein
MAIVCGWCGVALAALPTPPRDVLTIRVGDREYVQGAVYLTAHADTLLLKPFGFRQFVFDGWTLSRVRYEAIWPRTVKVDSLPPQVSGLDYDVRESIPDSTDTFDRNQESLPADSLLKPAEPSEGK